MSTTIDSKVKTVALRNQGVFGMPGIGKTKYKYKSELTITGKHPNRQFLVDVYREEDGISIRIGSRNDVGRLDQEGSQTDDLEKHHFLTIDYQTKLPTAYWAGLIGDEELKTLTMQEMNRLAIATGNDNQALDSDTSGAIFVDGGNNTLGDSATDTGGVLTGDGTPLPDNDKDDENQKPFWDTYEWDIDGINTRLTNINIKGRSFRDTYKNLYYPEGLGSNRQDRIRFTQKYSQGRKVNVSLGSDTKVFQREPEIKIDGSVTLPIVTGIGDRNAVDWKDESLNPIQALGAGAAVSIFEGVKKDGLTEAFNNAKGAFQGAAGALKEGDVGGNVAKAINVYLAQQAVGAQGLLSRATGAILNPNLEMLFGGPKLRSFGFTFKLSPRDASEADQVRQIIRFFKQGMSVKTSASNVFLQAPNTFDIQYQTFNTDGALIDHPSINFIKTCALTSCDVQYTPEGTYMTYEDPYRTMTSYQLTLNFSELDPIFDDDYTDLDDNDDTSIGY